MRNKNGFTLIELLVVVSIIGILTSLVMSNMNSARERARDAQRKSDLRSIQTALRLYYNDTGRYPCSDSSSRIRACGTGACGSVSVCNWDSQWAVGTTVYMNKLPNDPLPGVNYKYDYNINDDSYTLDACLENKSDVKGQVAVGAWCTSLKMYEVKP